MLIMDSKRLRPIPASWHQPLRNWEIYLRSQGNREATVDTRIRHLRQLARDLKSISPEDVTPENLITWSGSHTWQPETRHSYHQSVKECFAYIRPGDSPAEQLPTIRRPLQSPRPTPEKVITDALSKQPSWLVTTAILLAAEMGLRRNEIVTIRWSNIDTSQSPWVLTVDGKGGTTRALPVSLAVKLQLEKVPVKTGYLFPGNQDGHISGRWLSKLVMRVMPAGWTLHTLRHRFATVGYQRSGHDLIALKQALGHASLTTTQRYAAASTDALTNLIAATSIERN